MDITINVLFRRRKFGSQLANLNPVRLAVVSGCLPIISFIHAMNELLVRIALLLSAVFLLGVAAPYDLDIVNYSRTLFKGDKKR
jgi:hypothetical protein